MLSPQTDKSGKSGQTWNKIEILYCEWDQFSVRHYKIPGAYFMGNIVVYQKCYGKRMQWNILLSKFITFVHNIACTYSKFVIICILLICLNIHDT